MALDQGAVRCTVRYKATSKRALQMPGEARPVSLILSGGSSSLLSVSVVLSPFRERTTTD